jgi:hypothetical protein
MMGKHAMKVCFHYGQPFPDLGMRLTKCSVAELPTILMNRATEMHEIPRTDKWHAENSIVE